MSSVNLQAEVQPAAMPSSRGAEFVPSAINEFAEGSRRGIQRLISPARGLPPEQTSPHDSSPPPAYSPHPVQGMEESKLCGENVEHLRRQNEQDAARLRSDIAARLVPSLETIEKRPPVDDPRYQKLQKLLNEVKLMQGKIDRRKNRKFPIGSILKLGTEDSFRNPSWKKAIPFIGTFAILDKGKDLRSQNILGHDSQASNILHDITDQMNVLARPCEQGEISSGKIESVESNIRNMKEEIKKSSGVKHYAKQSVVVTGYALYGSVILPTVVNATGWANNKLRKTKI